MILVDVKTEDIGALLTVSDSFVSKWNIRYENEGASAFKLHYQGGTGFLTEDPRDESIFPRRRQPHSSVEARRDDIERHSGVVYQSKPSYDDLLHEGRLSWHQTPAATPNRDKAPVWRKREEIKETRAARQAAIVSGAVIVLAEEECQVVWGDAIGYGWGRQKERTEVPMATGKHRQT